MAKKSSRKQAKRKKTITPPVETKPPADNAPGRIQDEQEKKAYEARLQRRLQILRQYLEEGRIKFAAGLKIIESLKAVRYAADGSVELSTVDGLVRAVAVGIEGSHERDELKKSMSLAEIQTTYFKFLESNFGFFYEIMLKRGLTPHDAGMAASQNNLTVEEITKPLPDFVRTIEEFWRNCADAAQAHVEDMHDTLKGIFGGDLFPSHEENIASKCGLYTDTIVLPDPFLRTKHVFEHGKPKDHAYYFMKHALNLLQYRELACADVNPPVVVVLPDMSAIDKREYEFYKTLGRDDALTHAGKVFGRRFNTMEELMAFAKTLETVDRVAAAIADQNRILFDAELKRDFRAQIAKATQGNYAGLLGTKHPGIIVASLALGYMNTSNELLIKSQRLRGTPVIDAPTFWQYFVWKLEYDAEKAQDSRNLADLHVLRGLQSLAQSDMQWLGRVPPKALLEVRKTQALAEIRSVLGKGVAELAHANPMQFPRTTDRVFDNIQYAFEEHRKSIKELSAKKWKFAGSSIGSWLVAGSIEVTAAATGYPTWGIAAYAASELLNAPKLREIPKSIVELARESKELKRSPVGMLFRFSGDK